MKIHVKVTYEEVGGGNWHWGQSSSIPSRKEQLRAVLIGTGRAREQGGPEVPKHFQLSDGTA